MMNDDDNDDDDDDDDDDDSDGTNEYFDVCSPWPLVLFPTFNEKFIL